MSEEEKQELYDAWKEFKKAVLELFKIEEIVEWLSKILNKVKGIK